MIPMARYEDDAQGGNSLPWFLFGIGLGAALGLLFAPQSGAETRRSLGKKVRKLRHLAEDRLEDQKTRNPVAADRLLDEVEACSEFLNAFPGLGAPRDDLGPGLRSLRLRQFRQALLYRELDEGVVLLRLLHSSRRAPDSSD